jgi:predicted nucleic acid-binding protein
LTNADKQTGRVVFDTMVVIKYINKKPGFIDIGTAYAEDEWLISFITRMEVLAFPGISAAERERALAFLQDVLIIPNNDEIEAAAIEIRRKYRPKLPDAIVAATALEAGASLITGDGPLSKKNIPGLHIIAVPSPSTRASWRSVFRKNFGPTGPRSLWAAIDCFIISTLVFASLFFLK